MENKFNSMDYYVNSEPNDFNSINLFNNEWSSRLPGDLESFGGKSNLFDDPRVNFWTDKVIEIFSHAENNPGSFNVLELGPLEGGHTFMLSKKGWNITAIESNSRAFIKCLIVSNIFKTNAKFMLGNFEQYFNDKNSLQFDFILASGVLYHLKKPSETIRIMLEHCESIGIWTHYITSEYISKHPRRWTETSFIDTKINKSVHGWMQYYNEGLENPGFCGGGQEYSIWLTKDQILSTIESCGFSYDINSIDEESESGPNMTLFAYRKNI